MDGDKPIEEKPKSYSFKVEIKLPQQDIDDIMCTALEGGINQWVDRKPVPYGMDFRGADYAHEVLTRGGSLLIATDDEPDELHELTLEKFLAGIQMYMDRYGFIDDAANVDAGDADMIVQFALFGKLVYG